MAFDCLQKGDSTAGVPECMSMSYPDPKSPTSLTQLSLSGSETTDGVAQRLQIESKHSHETFPKISAFWLQFFFSSFSLADKKLHKRYLLGLGNQ